MSDNTCLCCSQLLFQPPDSTVKKSSMRSAQRPGSGMDLRRLPTSAPSSVRQREGVGEGGEEGRKEVQVKGGM